MTAEPGSWLDRVALGESNHAPVQTAGTASSRPQIAHDEVAALLAALFALQIRAGRPALRLDSDAIALLVQRSGGTRHALRILAELAMFVARLEDASCITVAHVEAAWLIDQETSDLDDGPAEAEARVQPLSASASQRLPPPSVFTFATREWPGRRVTSAGIACVVIALGVGLALAFRPARQLSAPLAAATPTAPEMAMLAPPAIAAQPIPATAAVAARPGSLLHSEPPGPVLAASAAPAPLLALASPALAAPALSLPAHGLELAALPDGAVLHVSVAYPRGSAESERRAVEAIGTLRAAGYDVAGPEQVAVAHSRQIAIGYFFAEDEAGAATIAQRVGGRAQLLPVPSGALPHPGTIRINLSSYTSTGTLSAAE